MIEFRMLGTLGLTSGDGREIRSLLSQPKRLALLTYLAIARPYGFHRRDTLLALFWANSDETHARNALRQALHYLRRSLGPDVIVSRGEDELGLDVERLHSDVVELLSRVEAGDPEAALELYEGELLPGFHVDDAAGFERWLDEERDHIRRVTAGAAFDLSRTAEATDDLTGAVNWARRRSEILPHDEDALRCLVQLMDESGNGVAALHEYDAFVERWQSEDGWEPSAQTRALADVIRDRRDGPVDGAMDGPVDGRADEPAVRAPTAAVRTLEPGTRSWWPVTPQVAVIGTLTGVGAMALLAGASGFLGRDNSPRRTVANQRQVTFVGNVVEASVSPEGEFLAYTTQDAEGAKLIVRDLESSSTIEVVSRSDPIGSPNWSPDGRQLLVPGGLATDFSYLAYPRLGGAPRVIPVRGGGRWSADGRHVFHWGQGGSEFGMFALATESEARIRTADTTAWINDVVPHPDGSVLALLHKSRVGLGSSIWRLTMDDASPLDGLPRDSTDRIAASYDRWVESEADIYSVTWSPTGSSLYYLEESQGTFELRKLRFAADGEDGREPEVLMSGLDVGAPARPWESLLSVGGDGSEIFFVKGSRFSNLWTTRSSGDGWEVVPLTTGTANDRGPSASPDGEWVAYASTVAGRTNIFLVPSAGGPTRQLTHVDSVSGYPVWSPDGASVAFGLRRDGGNHVVTVQVDGPPRLRVFEGTTLGGNGMITWAPGSEILYERPGLRSFHFLDPETETERPLLSEDSDGFLLSAHYAPDGTQVLLRHNRQPSSLAGLYVSSLAGSLQERLAGEPYAAAIGWSEDGQVVYALAQDGRQVVAIPVDGGPAIEAGVLPFEADNRAATFNGRWFVFSSAAAIGDVWGIENFDPDP